MIVHAILLRDQEVTQHYLYIKCYPLFKAVYDNYYTDCQTCVEFIHDIYIHLMTPHKDKGICKLQSFHFNSTLTTWLKTVAVYYCYERYRRKLKIPFVKEKTGTDSYQSDRFSQYASSMYTEEPLMHCDDLETILSMMPNKRYSMIIRLRYLEGMSNEETAISLGMSLDNFYNKHMRAKKQFNDIIKKESRDGKLL